MLINSVFGLLVPLAAYHGEGWMMAVRFIQGLGEGPIVPCTHAMLSNWIPPSERSKLGAFVYAGECRGRRCARTALSCTGWFRVTANGIHIPTFLIFEVQQKREVENAHKRRSNLVKIFKFKNFVSCGRGPGRPWSCRIAIFAYGDPMLNRWPLDDYSVATCRKEFRAL